MYPFSSPGNDTWIVLLAIPGKLIHQPALSTLRKKGIGTGLFNGLIQIAYALHIKMIWGEATVNSAPFYERILGAERIFDQFHIQGDAMDYCRRELARIHQRGP